MSLAVNLMSCGCTQLTSAAAIFGHSLVESWTVANEPQLHRSTTTVAELVDAAVERQTLSLDGVKSLSGGIATHIASTMAESGSEVSTIVAFKVNPALRGALCCR